MLTRGARHARLTRTLTTVAAAAVLVPLGLVAVATASHAAGSTIVDESFANATPDNDSWSRTGVPSEQTNLACLTASSETGQTPLPGCPGEDYVDALRLTTATQSSLGGVAYAGSVATSAGLDVSFDSYQYAADGEPADGIAFFLAAADPDPSVVPSVTLGVHGGNLGYGAGNGTGLTNAYLGVGLDVYGNFSNEGASGPACEDASAFAPQSVVVRGPGSGSDGYCLLQTTTLETGQLDSPSWAQGGDASPPPTSAAPAVPVRVVINPTDSSVTPEGTEASVPAMSYWVHVSPLGGDPVTLTGDLPTLFATERAAAANSDPGTYPDGWVDSTTGLPKRLTFGWVGSTGAGAEEHAVNNVTVRTVVDEQSGALQFINQPVDSQTGQPMRNSDNTVRHVTVGAYTGDESNTLDTSYAGTVTLHAPTGAHFVVDGVDTTTMTATASGGVADFSPIVISPQGFGYTLTATDDTGRTEATSSTFTVAEAAKSCATNNCTTSPPPATDTSTATVQGQKGDIITATFGGDVAPLIGCDKADKVYSEILTVTGSKPKTIRLTVPLFDGTPRFNVCFSSPLPFTTKSGHPAVRNPANDNWYEGHLRRCHYKDPGPCVLSYRWNTTRETVQVKTGAADPRINV